MRERNVNIVDAVATKPINMAVFLVNMQSKKERVLSKSLDQDVYHKNHT